MNIVKKSVAVDGGQLWFERANLQLADPLAALG